MARLRLFLLFTLPAALLTAQDPYRANWISVADRLIENRPEVFPYNWGEGVQAIGLMKAYEQTRQARYLEWMKRWTALHASKAPAELLNILEAPHSREHSAYCGHWSPGTAILLLNRFAPDPGYRRIVEATADFIRSGAERSPEGGLGHWKGSHQLWVDTLYMACPLLAAWGQENRNQALVDDAADQILIYSRHLQDPKTGLFYHMWDWQSGERTPGPWGRGNGWVVMSIADTMEALGRDHRLRAPLAAVLDRLLAGMAATQDRSGLWRTVLDDPASYVECSASSMVVYGVLKLTRLGVIPRSQNAMALKAWAAVNRRFVSNGLVTGVSTGTVPKGREYYRALPAGVETWGTGAYLLAGSEVDQLR